MSDRWQSDAEICTNLGIKKDTVYKCISEKDMPAHRLGELWKFKISEVDEWVKRDIYV
jgi:excisionase family DNA binding protein